MFHCALSPMMSHSPSTGPNRKDDGFRIADAVVERAIQDVMATPRDGRVRRLIPMVSMAASIALIFGVGVAFSEAMKPEPCVTFACQLEAMSDEELAGMVELMEEESLIELEAESWTTLY
jgi:hypothetical protein